MLLVINLGQKLYYLTKKIYTKGSSKARTSKSTATSKEQKLTKT